jgi:hypothetical protein
VYSLEDRFSTNCLDPRSMVPVPATMVGACGGGGFKGGSGCWVCNEWRTYLVMGRVVRIKLHVTVWALAAVAANGIVGPLCRAACEGEA